MCFYGRFNITSTRGYRNIGSGKEYHGGLDIVAVDDKTVRAIADGKVQVLNEPSGFGTYIRQTIYDEMRVYYGHMSKTLVPNGSYVHKGDAIGIMGSTGRSTGAHTHLELRPKGTSKDSLDIAGFCGILNKVGEYCYYPTSLCADKIKRLCGLSDATMDFLKSYKAAEDLLNKLYVGMCKAAGIKGTTAYHCACLIQDRCGISKDGMAYMWTYKFAEDLLKKLWSKMS